MPRFFNLAQKSTFSSLRGESSHLVRSREMSKRFPFCFGNSDSMQNHALIVPGNPLSGRWIKRLTASAYKA
jgi:hypothetical protein